jgi:hypothetical protein
MNKKEEKGGKKKETILFFTLFVSYININLKWEN